jgi:hypothetical protein
MKFRPRGGVCNIPLWHMRKLILRGHLLTSDPDYYAIKTFDFDYEALWVDDMV